MRAFHYFRLFLFVSLLVNPSLAFAEGFKQQTSLSTGIVFPSDNSAVHENGAQLLKSQKRAELLVNPEGRVKAEGTLVGSSKTAGYGVGLQYLGTDLHALGGVGFGSNQSRLGLDGSYNFSTGRFVGDLGLGVDMQGGTSFAGVLRNINGGVDSLVVGIGYREMSHLRLEADIEYIKASDAWFIDPAVSIDMSQGHLTLLIGYRIQIGSSTGSARLGVNFWITNNVSVEYLYQTYFGQHAVGMKFGL